MGQATTEGYTVSDQRVGSRVDIEGIEEGVNAVVGEAFRRRGGPLLGRPIAWFERPSILAYGPGGHYIAHADARYVHRAETVTRGERHVIVSWAAAAGTARVQPAPPKGIIRLI